MRSAEYSSPLPPDPIGTTGSPLPPGPIGERGPSPLPPDPILDAPAPERDPDESPVAAHG